MDGTENKRKWDSFLKPLTSFRKESKDGSSIKIKDKIPGTQYLSQIFANKLLEKIETPILVKGNLEELRKVTKDFQKQDVFSRPSVCKVADETSSPSGDVGMTISIRNDDGSKDSADANRDFHILKNRKPDVIEIAGGNNEGHRKSRPVDENTFSSTDLINVELFEYSSENPIAISDDESMDESLETETFSIPRKRKQDNRNDFDVSELPPPKRDRESSPKRSEGDIIGIEDIAQSTHGQNPDLKTEERPYGSSDERVPSMSKRDVTPSTSTSESHLHKTPVSADIRQTSSWLSDTKERDGFNAIGVSELQTNHTSKTNVDDGEEKITDNVKEDTFGQRLTSNNITDNELRNKKENNYNANMAFQTSSLGNKSSSSVTKFDMIFEEGNPTVSTKLLAYMHAGQIPLLERDHSIERTRVRGPSKKDDIDKSCSLWWVELFACYFNFKDCVKELELDQLSKVHVPIDEMVSNFRSRIKIASSTVTYDKRNTDETLNFTSLCRTEVGARLILNEIFFPLCSYLDLSVEIERNVDCSYLPYCRFDYRIVNADGDVVGAVEAKSAGSLRPESVAQAAIELCILQTERLTKRKGSQHLGATPLFNVLTDGVRYVFIVLQGDKLQFEQSFNKIRVRELTTWDEVKSLYKSLSQLLCIEKNAKDLSEVVEL